MRSRGKARALSVLRSRSITSRCCISFDVIPRRHSLSLRKPAAFAGNIGSIIMEHGARWCGPGPLQNKAPLQEGLAAYDAALKEFAETGAGLRMPHYLCLLAAIQRKAGRRAAGLKIVAEATEIAERTLETWCNAELERERGELLLLDPSNDASKAAEAAFKRAIDIAANQGAKMLQLRASAALARALGRAQPQQGGF